MHIYLIPLKTFPFYLKNRLFLTPKNENPCYKLHMCTSSDLLGFFLHCKTGGLLP